ncbi:hypothetical protein ElyMa_005782700 [Elysia marginata]|uniref:Ig-like domain-containing protein n=1 Tax=Elysia marginata TaxID=1093978 RepID=A0AAV4FQG8_9GAST|nr:hypothetical protein ElyMa_005782700 [Elysia marginata]
MKIVTEYTVMTTIRQSTDDSPTCSNRAKCPSPEEGVINVQVVEYIERRTRSISITDSEYDPCDVGSDLQDRDVDKYNATVLHSYSVGPSDAARQKRALYDSFEPPKDEQPHKNKTAEWVFYHSFSNIKPEQIPKPIDKQYTHTGGRNGRYTCNICAMDSNVYVSWFNSHADIKDHLKNTHNLKGHYICKLCQKVYARPPAFYEHVQKEHYIKPDDLGEFLEPPLVNEPSAAMPSVSCYIAPQVKIEASDEPPQKIKKQ